jgi:putative flippase GtrA
MIEPSCPADEAELAMKIGAVGLVGFAVDAVLLRAGLALHLTAAIARLLSLALAMQVTFAINRTFVFKCEGREGLVRQWCAYMATNGFGNLCNYWIFVTLSSLHGRVVSQWFVALPAAAFSAYLINYAGVRLVVFGRRRIKRRPPAVAAAKGDQLGTT